MLRRKITMKDLNLHWMLNFCVYISHYRSLTCGNCRFKFFFSLSFIYLFLFCHWYNTLIVCARRREREKWREIWSEIILRKEMIWKSKDFFTIDEILRENVMLYWKQFDFIVHLSILCLILTSSSLSCMIFFALARFTYKFAFLSLHSFHTH